MINNKPQKSSLAKATFIIACALLTLSLLMGLLNLPYKDMAGLDRPFGFVNLYGMIILFIIGPLNILFGLVALGHLLFSHQKGLYLVIAAEIMSIVSLAWFSWI